MRNYLNLTRFEVNRFFKLHVTLVVLTFLTQLVGAVVIARHFMDNATKTMQAEQLTERLFVERYGAFSFRNYVYSEWFLLPIMLCVAVLGIYVFFIWYRDWFAKNTFIYRLLMLPTARITVYFAKLTAIMLFVLSLVALQIGFVWLERALMQVVIPPSLTSHFSLLSIFEQDILGILYPNTFLAFILLYGAGLLFVAVIFTGILLERSYRWKGIVYAVVYAVLAAAVIITPLLMGSVRHYLYPLELAALGIVLGITVFASAIWLASKLLNDKIKV